MYKLLSITALFALLCAASAMIHVPGFKVADLKIQRVDTTSDEAADFIDLDALSRQGISGSTTSEDAEFAVEKYQTGYARVVQTGITVQKGTGGFLKFRIRARGVDSETISKADQSYSEVLEKTSNSQLINKYKGLKKKFGGSLNIPLLDFLGFNFLKAFNKQQAEQTAKSYGTTTYNALSSEAAKVLESFVETQVEISGSLYAQGVSFIPTTAVAFLRFARVEFGENQSTNVYSSSTSDLIAGTPGGQSLPATNKDIQILTPTRR